MIKSWDDFKKWLNFHAFRRAGDDLTSLSFWLLVMYLENSSSSVISMDKQEI